MTAFTANHDAINTAMRAYSQDEGDWPTGEMVDVVAEATIRSTPVYVLQVDHKYGEDTTVHLSEDAAKDTLYAWVQGYWEEVAGRVGHDEDGRGYDVPDQPPANRDEAIQVYFEAHGRESYFISEPLSIQS